MQMNCCARGIDRKKIDRQMQIDCASRIDRRYVDTQIWEGIEYRQMDYNLTTRQANK